MMITNNQTRLLPITAGAVASTFAIFYLMQGLVASDVIDLQEIRKRPAPQIYLEEIKPLKAREIDRLPPPPPVEPEPEMVMDRSPSTEGISLEIGQGPLPYIPSTAETSVNLGFSDGERLPLVRVQPTYPRRALERGIEGWVVLQFTVTKHGMVEDAVVIEAEPQGIFDKAALKAIQRFKYKPTVVDGEPRTSKGNRFRMVFELAVMDQ